MQSDQDPLHNTAARREAEEESRKKEKRRKAEELSLIRLYLDVVNQHEL